LKSVSRTKLETLPLVDERNVTYLSDASESTHSDLLNDAMAESGDCYPVEQGHGEGTLIDSLQHSDVPERPSNHINRKKRSKSSSLPTSFAPVVPARQDQSQASYLDSALHRKVSESSPRRYSTHN
jgi:hypothetical protein